MSPQPRDRVLPRARGRPARRPRAPLADDDAAASTGAPSTRGESIQHPCRRLRSCFSCSRTIVALGSSGASFRNCSYAAIAVAVSPVCWAAWASSSWVFGSSGWSATSFLYAATAGSPARPRPARAAVITLRVATPAHRARDRILRDGAARPSRSAPGTPATARGRRPSPAPAARPAGARSRASRRRPASSP